MLSIKTGGCPEDCQYCPQSARYQTEVDRNPLMETEEVLAEAKKAKDEGASRFCLGAAWREVKDNDDFESVLGMVRGVRELGLEVCCTLGMITQDQALRLKEAGALRLQSQPGHLVGVLLPDHFDSNLSGSSQDIGQLSKGGPHPVLGGDHRHGRVGR